MYVFFVFNVAKIKYNLTKKNVYDIFNMRLCIKEMFDVKKGLLKLFLITFILSYILVTLYGIGASEVITEGYTIIT